MVRYASTAKWFCSRVTPLTILGCDDSRLGLYISKAFSALLIVFAPDCPSPSGLDGITDQHCSTIATRKRSPSATRQGGISKSDRRSQTDYGRVAGTSNSAGGDDVLQIRLKAPPGSELSLVRRLNHSFRRRGRIAL
jgi:hypothetical protein